MRKLSTTVLGYLVAVLCLGTTPVLAADSDSESAREIEEMVIYGKRVESTVSDTSIAITAMDEEFLKDMGVQGPNEMVNFIPATTRTDWDVKIRGVGRNFRGLGGDPGVGTYYNGIYSPDFGIAATEGGLYDIQRIEVLRGPQGTLYGRNSIGGVINYVTNQPNHDEFEASARIMLGKYDTNEYFGFLSGPITDTLAYRLNGVKRKRDGAIKGIGGSEDVEGVNDQNVALTLDWNITDNISANLRINDRRSLRAGNFGNGGHGVPSEGPCVGVHPIDDVDDCDPRYRVPRDTDHYVAGFRGVSADYAAMYGDLKGSNANCPPHMSVCGAVPWTHPVTGATAYGAYNRPGVDPTGLWPFMPSANYRSAAVASYDIGSPDAPDIVALTNDSADEEFDQQAASLVVDWDISDRLSVRYLGNYQGFVYWFNRDNDFSNSLVSDNNDTVVADTESWSHEIRVFWELGDRWSATSGFYNFYESRDQWYGIRERAGQGRVINPTNYGVLLDALAVVGWVVPPCYDWRTAPINQATETTPGYGLYCGDPGEAYNHDNDSGAVYEHRNYVDNENLAFYTQGDLRLTDTLSVTLGVRYSKDWRDGLEQRGGYSEITAGGWIGWAVACATGGAGVDPSQGGTDIGCPVIGNASIPGVDWWDHFGDGVTGLAAMNVAMGNATYTGNPDFPVAPTCDYLAVTCDTPMRLEGVPISWGHRTSGSFKQKGDWSYRVNFNWEPTDNMLFYAGVTTSYRAGGWNMGGPENRNTIDSNGNGTHDLRALLNYDGEELTSYEVGYKGTHLDGTLQLNVAVYYYDYKNYQDHVEKWETESSDFSLPNVSGIDLSAPGRGPVSITTNIPSAHNKGFEVDALYLLTDNLTIGGNMSYTVSKYDASFTFFNEDDPRYPRNVFGGDLTKDPCDDVAELASLYCLDVDGYELQGIPKTKATGWASYSWNFSAGSLTWYNAVSYTGKYDTHPFSRPWDQVPARERWDMRLSFREASGKWNASLFVDNVLDKTYIRSSDMDRRRLGYGMNWGQRVVALYPRFWGVEATYNFGAAR